MDIDAFIEDLSTRTRSAETLRAYRGDLEKYETFLRARGLRVTQATSTTVQEFIQYLCARPTRKARERLSEASIARRLAVLSSFYEFLRFRSNGKISNPVSWVKRPKVQNVAFRAIDETTLSKLLGGISDARDKAILALFLSSALRLSELQKLDKTTISRKQTKLPDGRVRTLGVGQVLGKGNKWRSFLIDEHTIDLIVDYLRIRGVDNQPALFLSSRNQRISCRNVRDILHRHCRRLGLTRCHIHALRHSAATRFVNGGMPLTVLQELLGHTSPTVTQRYFRIRPERLAREYFAAWEFTSMP